LIDLYDLFSLTANWGRLDK